MPIQPEPRWLSIVKPLAKEDAEAARDEQIRCWEANIVELQAQISHLKSVPLPITTEEYIPVLPDDPRYAEAEDKFDPKRYQGTWKF